MASLRPGGSNRVVEDGQVQLGQALAGRTARRSPRSSRSSTVNAITENDPARRDYDDARGPVHQGGPHVGREPRESERSLGHRLRAVDDRRVARPSGAPVGAQHDVRVEHGDQRVEVAAASGREERVHDLALVAEIGVGWRRPRSGRAGGHGSPAGAPPPASDPPSARSRRTARRTCRAARRPGARQATASRAPPAARGRPSRRAVPRCSGSSPSSRLTIGSGTCTSSGSSRRVLRERSMFRQTRATTVVSHPPRFSTWLASERLSRSQASCTASSASLTEPSIR